MKPTLPIALFLLSPSLVAQSFNIDFGDPDGAHGLPDAAYGAGASMSGHWQAMDSSGGTLTDLQGNPTSVEIDFSKTMAVVECDHPLTTGGDDSLLDDRLRLPPQGHGGVYLTIRNLAPGDYRVLLYAIESGSCSWADTVYTRIGNDGQFVTTNWEGEFVAGETHSHHLVSNHDGGILYLSAEGNQYETMLLSGLQIERLEHLSTYCFGDGSGAACPCANPGGPGEGCASSVGGGAMLEGLGSTSVFADELEFRAQQMRPDQPALLIVGTSDIQAGAGLPLGDGLRCAGGSVLRLGTVQADGAGQAQWGPGLIAAGGIEAGDVRYFQTWFRDPGASPCGSGFNLTPGVRAYFQP